VRKKNERVGDSKRRDRGPRGGVSWSAFFYAIMGARTRTLAHRRTWFILNCHANTTKRYPISRHNGSFLYIAWSSALAAL